MPIKSDFSMTLRKPVLWIDIDGTVRHGPSERGGRFVNEPEDVVIFAEVPRLLAAYRRAGWRVVGVSNQGGIALGHVTLEQALLTMRRTIELCKLDGNQHPFDKIAICRHHPEADDPEMAVCWCRKPRIGLLVESGLDLAKCFGEIYPPHMGLFVGDMEDDRRCAENAGLRFMTAADWRALDPATIR